MYGMHLFELLLRCFLLIYCLLANIMYGAKS